jgi:hypothetical protein
VKLRIRSLTSFSRQSRRCVAALLLALASLVALVGPACSSNDVAASLYKGCAQNSDCDKTLICALGLCRPVCKTTADCGNGGACITDDMMHAVCQSATLNNKACDKPSECPSPLACASDYRCRNLCSTSADCNVGGSSGRVCAIDANGVNYCANPPEVNAANMIVAPPPATHLDAAVTEPMLDATVGSGDGAGKGDGTPGSDAPVTLGDASGDGTSGGDGNATCTPACGPGQQCVNGTCATCGKNPGDPCCGGTCFSNLTCTSAGKCACGDPGQACCGGSTCNSGVTCVTGASPTCACGRALQACCPASGDAGGTAQCTAPLQCAGIDCSCLVACSGSAVQDTGGAIWTSPTVPITVANASKFTAGNFAYSGNLGCAVKSDGSVWCWGNNSYGQLGIGTTMPTSSTLPVQVLMGASGPPLANATKVFVDGYSGYSACAIDSNGAAWCWGYGTSGQLGNGTMNNSLFAAPVLTASGGPQLTGVDQISISDNHTCARTTNGSAWCWGSNSNGQIGVGNSNTQTPYLYPAQVTNLSNTVTSISVGSNVSCASTTDGGVWCWGDNSYGVLANGLRTGNAIVPAQIAVGDAGTPFGGATRVELMYYGYSACALKGADNSLWCWGYYSPMNSLYPVQYTESMVAISNVFVLCSNQQSSNSLSFIDNRGAFHNGGSASSQQVACP